MIQFTDSLWLAGVLSIDNWNASATSDQLSLANQPSQDSFNHVQFSGYEPGAIWTGTIVIPIPEPSSLGPAAAGLLLRCLIAARRPGRSGTDTNPRPYR